MEGAIVEALKNSPLAIILFWMVYAFNKKDDSRTEHIKELQSRMLDVIDHNTQALTEVKSTVQENTRATRSLSSRIYDVLAKDTNK